MKKGYLKKETESNIVAAQDQANGKNIQSIRRVSVVGDETVAHIVSNFSKLAQKEYKQVKHYNIAKMLYWKLCEKWGFNKAEKWYIHKTEKVLESEDCHCKKKLFFL